MEIEPRGRIHQDSEFIFSEFDGLKIESLNVCREIESNEPVLIFLKVKGQNWHQYFLDAGIGFWEDWNKIDLQEEKDDDEYFELVDFTYKYQLSDKEIAKIYCEKELNNSRITIELKDKSKLILKCANPELFDSYCELILTQVK